MRFLMPRLLAPEHHDRWRHTLADQYGLLSLEQVVGFRLSPDVIRENVRAGRWQPVAPRVYATFTGPLTRESRIAAALLYAGPVAVLSHQTAAEMWGMRPEVSGPVHVTVPYQRSAVSQLPLVMVHRSRAFGHIAVDGRPPLTSRADTAIDLASAAPTAREAQHVLIDLVTSRRVARERIRERLSARPPRRYVRALEQALGRIAAGVESVLEDVYAVDVEAAHGLPTARRQAPFAVDGRTLFEDAVYDHVGVPLTVRLNGGTHLQADVAERDRRRDNAAELAGRARLVFGWPELSTRPCVAAAKVRAVLQRHGWQGPMLRCPKCPAQEP